jgi:hypothetical protein
VRKNPKRAGPRQINEDVDALGHCEREMIACHWMYRMTVGCDHAADGVTKLDPKLTRGRAVDDPEAM